MTQGAPEVQLDGSSSLVFEVDPAAPPTESVHAPLTQVRLVHAVSSVTVIRSGPQILSSCPRHTLSPGLLLLHSDTISLQVPASGPGRVSHSCPLSQAPAESHLPFRHA